jgi:tryptophan synthase alpha chain
MSRIDQLFADKREKKKRALVVYLCVGDPSLDASLRLGQAALDSGADMLELGVPYNDPTADGPVISRASERAILAGSSLTRTIELAAKLRRNTQAPLVLFGYYNPILVHGERRTVEEAKLAGIDGLLVVDLPPEEGAGLRDAADLAGLAVVPLLTPTSGPARVAAAVRRARGCIYYVSVTGVTGKAGDEALFGAAADAARLREATKLPVIVGFGIDGPRKARIAVGRGSPNDGNGGTRAAAGLEPGTHLDGGDVGADGIVVGTAIVKAIESAQTDPARVLAVKQLVGSLRAALDTA